MTSETSETTIFVRFYFTVCYLMLSRNVVFFGYFGLDARYEYVQLVFSVWLTWHSITRPSETSFMKWYHTV